MSLISISIAPTLAMQSSPTGFVLPVATIDQSKIDTVRLVKALWEVKAAFAASGAIKTAGDTVALTVAIDGTLT